MRTRIIKWLIGVTLFLAVVVVISAVVASRRLGPFVRDRLEDAVRQRFASEIELEEFDLSLLPTVIAKGRGVVLRHHGRTDVPPLFSVDRFSIETGLRDLLADRKRIRKLRLEGLRIVVPMGRPSSGPPAGPKSPGPPIHVDEIIADGARLEVLPRKPNKQPLTFELRKLALRSVAKDRPMSFRAVLTNATPPGLIETLGEFGPWQAEEPSQTAVSGSYTFRNADLSVFRGISGTLYSEGKYRGALGHIEAQGFTDTPDFGLAISGAHVHLKTEFQAVIDGTDGDTMLQPVHAQFLRSSAVARGGVIGTKGVNGKTVALDLSIPQARVADLLRLAIKSPEPFMTGMVNLRTKFHLPPGERDVVEKLTLNGEFDVSNAKFRNLHVQEKVEQLSRRARGQADGIVDEQEIASDFKGWFQLRNGVMEFSRLSFSVPGAFIKLRGTYSLRDELMDFHGTARMDAKVSQMTKGFKSVLLRAVDPFFKRSGAGAVIPIKITGTRQQPSFGLELRRK